MSGDRIVEIFGKNFRGLSLSEIHPAESVPRIFRLFKRVVSEPALQEFRGTVFNQLNRVGIGARILLPLSTEGVMADGCWAPRNIWCVMPNPIHTLRQRQTKSVGFR